MTSTSHQSLITNGESSCISECYCCCYCCCIAHPQQQLVSNTTTPSLPSTECTTPVDFNALQDNDISITDLEKMRTKKLHAIIELLQTERDYVQDLSYLVETYLDALSQQQWITTEHKSIIIRNSHKILAFHKQFIISYNITSLSDYNWSFIAKAFLDQIGQFSLYKHYCDMHAEAWTLTSEYRDRTEWVNFIKECEFPDPYSISSPTSPEFQQEQHQLRKLHFEDYLIKPVQRICRYQLLIKEIIRYTSSQTAEYDLWNSVLGEMQDLVSEIDDRKLQRDMKEKTERFIERLDNDWRISKVHVSQLGNLLIAGAIEITYSALGQSVSKPRYLGCFVFPSYIIMVRPKKVTSYEPKYWFPLRIADFEDLTDIEGQRENSFIIRCKKHTFVFNATCSQEKQVWTRRLEEAIDTAKNEASNLISMSAQDFIVSSLPGITNKRPPQSIRLSRSFTNLLDMTFSGNTESIKEEIDDASPYAQLARYSSRKSLRRSISTTIQIGDTIRFSAKHATLPTSISVTNPPLAKRASIYSLTQRYSVDYTALLNRDNNDRRMRLKPRNNSEMYIKPELIGLGLNRRRPSSLDLFSSANGTSSMIGKMSLQLKNNHQNALRVTVDHKLRDVCTQEYLSSRAWYIRDRDQHNSSPFHAPTSIQNSNSTSLTGSASHNDLLKKRKSSSFIRTSASSFSVMIPKRTSDTKQLSARTPEYDHHSVDSSCSSSMDRPISPTVIKFDRAYLGNPLKNSRSPSKSSQLLIHLLSQNQQETISEVPRSSNSEYSFTVSLNSKDSIHKQSFGRKKVFVGRVLRRISSFHQKLQTNSMHDQKLTFGDIKQVCLYTLPPRST
ncbi:MAG: hypothetical protein EXX96DRAFT_478411 [Benjaminiella poitrasii]|nr:MAG: hypothetical protein EXX96DRAFT_478411 [Benjaminiella poitrasii]